MAKLNSTYFKAVNKTVNNQTVKRNKTQITDFAKKCQTNKISQLNEQKNSKKYAFVITDPNLNFQNKQNQQQQLELSFSRTDDNQLFSARINAQEDQGQEKLHLQQNEHNSQQEDQTKTNNQEKPKGLTQQRIEKELKARLEAKEIQQRSYTVPGYQHDEQNKSLPTENAKNDLTVQQCLICFENEPNAVNMNCGHGGICYDCAVEIMQKTGECYLCRQKIIQILELDLKSKNNNQNELEVLQSARLVTCNHTDEQ